MAFLDPDETETAQEGVYLVYIFAADLRSVALTLNQGVTWLRQRFAEREARERLAANARAIREGLAPIRTTEYRAQIDLGVRRPLQLAYEAGNIAARVYETGALPSEEQPRADLRDLIALYQEAIEVKRRLLMASPGAVASPSAPRTTGGDDPLEHSRRRTTRTTSHISVAGRL